MMHKKILSVVGSMLLAAAPALAESTTGGDNFNPFASTNSGTTPPSKGGDSHFFTSTGSIIDNSVNNDQNGREYKLQDASRQGNAGQAGAIAAGKALSAAAAAELAALNIPEASRLFGLAGMEFAQAGIDGGTSAANSGLRSTLLADDGQNSRQSAYDPANVAQSLMTPESVKALTAQGVDPSTFFNALASGSVRSGTDALSALGQDPSTMSSDALSAVNDVSGADLKGILDGVALGVNDGATLNSSGGMASSSPTAPTSTSPFGSTSNASLSQPSAANRSSAGLPTKNGKLTSQGVGPSATSDGKDGAMHTAFEGMLPFGMDLKEKEKEEAGGYGGSLSRADLAAMGITRVKGQTIFKVASRNYHSFLKWRTMRSPKMKQPAVARGIASIP
jgi:hypothetical protein